MSSAFFLLSLIFSFVVYFLSPFLMSICFPSFFVVTFFLFLLSSTCPCALPTFLLFCILSNLSSLRLYFFISRFLFTFSHLYPIFPWWCLLFCSCYCILPMCPSFILYFLSPYYLYLSNLFSNFFLYFLLISLFPFLDTLFYSLFILFLLPLFIHSFSCCILSVSSSCSLHV